MVQQMVGGAARGDLPQWEGTRGHPLKMPFFCFDIYQHIKTSFSLTFITNFLYHTLCFTIFE